MSKLKPKINTKENIKLLSSFHTINDLLASSEQFSHHQNKLFDGLIIPPGFHALTIEPQKILVNKKCNDYLDDDEIYSKFIELASPQSYKKEKKLSRKKKNASKKIKTKKKKS